ncbi:MAG: hypothetical protein RL385_2749 [Pseudomonadota bacterium]|jgi:hypothetical protein
MCARWGNAASAQAAGCGAVAGALEHHYAVVAGVTLPRGGDGSRQQTLQRKAPALARHRRQSPLTSSRGRSTCARSARAHAQPAGMRTHRAPRCELRSRRGSPGRCLLAVRARRAPGGIVGHSYDGGVLQRLLLKGPERIRCAVLAYAGGLGRGVGFWLRLGSLCSGAKRKGSCPSHRAAPLQRACEA